MKTEDWQILVSLYHTKSLTQTAKSFYLTQPALTARLKSIEKELGLEIAVRSNRGILFTPEGKYLAVSASKILDQINETLEKTYIIQRQGKNVINICSNSTFTKYHLSEILSRYSSVNPDARFYIKVAISSMVPDYISTNICDCGFMNGSHSTKLPEKKIATQQAFIVYNKPFDSIQELKNVPLIMHNKDIPIQKRVSGWWKNQFGKSPEITMDVTTLDTCLEMVRNDFGCAVVFGEFWTKYYPGLYKEKLTDIDGITPFTRDTWFVYSNDLESSPYIADFVNFVINEFDEEFFRSVRNP